MKVYYNIDDIAYNPLRSVTVGTFDGLHRGHLRILNALKNAATESNASSFVITFDPHPQLVLKKDPADTFKILTDIDEKLELLSEQSIDECLVIKFDKDFSNINPEDFINIIHKKIGFKDYIIGYDHHFGKNRAGNENLVKNIIEKDNFRLIKVIAFQEHEVVLSSTKIRNAIKEGKITEANEMLGYNYSLPGKVISGAKRGRLIGFPTANIYVKDSNKLIPACGVYLVKSIIFGNSFYGMANIGFRPTFTDDTVTTLEVNFFDFSEEIYGANLKIEFLEFLREEKKFLNKEDLIAQIRLDELKCKSMIKYF